MYLDFIIKIIEEKRKQQGKKDQKGTQMFKELVLV